MQAHAKSFALELRKTGSQAEAGHGSFLQLSFFAGDSCSYTKWDVGFRVEDLGFTFRV